MHSQPVISTTTVLRKTRIETPINLGFRYYNTSMDMHNRYHNPQDYFCMIFREHFIQTFNALKYCKSLEPIDPLILEEKLIELPLHPISRIILSLWKVHFDLCCVVVLKKKGRQLSLTSMRRWCTAMRIQQQHLISFYL